MPTEKIISLNNLDRYDKNLKTVAGILQRSTAYALGDVVHNKNIYLKCTTAGTTKAETLDLTGVAKDDTVTDGTVVWTVTSTTGPASGESSGAGLEDWQASHSYKTDELFVYEGQIYKVLNNFTSGATFEETSNIEAYVPQELTSADIEELINAFSPSGGGGSGSGVIKDVLYEGTQYVTESHDYLIDSVDLTEYDYLVAEIVCKLYDSVAPNTYSETLVLLNTTSISRDFNCDIQGFRNGDGGNFFGGGMRVLDNTHIRFSPVTLGSYVEGVCLKKVEGIKFVSSWETVEIGKFVATAPAHYEREQLYTTNKTTITIYPTWININNHGYVLEGQKIIDIENADNWDDSTYTSAAQRAGKDFYIYACEPTSNDVPDFILSANSTIPTGYTADNSRKMGGFHCLCLSVGTISGHTLSGYNTGEILPNSPWDLKHRAVSENEGMVYIPEVNRWVDIYLTSWDGAKLVSEYNGAFVTGETTHKCHGEKFVEELGLVNKQLLTREEFMVIAKGSNENTAINGATNPITTGGHVDSNNRRMVSNYGVEDCCGTLWQWLATTAENYPGTTWDSNNYYFSGYDWQDKPVYNSTIDSQKYGSCAGLVRRFVSGGSWTNSSLCGSRCVSCNGFGTLVYASIGSRGSSTMRNNT